MCFILSHVTSAICVAETKLVEKSGSKHRCKSSQHFLHGLHMAVHNVYLQFRFLTEIPSILMLFVFLLSPCKKLYLSQTTQPLPYMSSEIHYSLSIRYPCTTLRNSTRPAQRSHAHSFKLAADYSSLSRSVSCGSGIKVKLQPGNEQYCLLVYDVVQSSRGLPTFQRNEQSVTLPT